MKDVLQNELSSVTAKIGEIETKKAKEQEELAATEAIDGSGVDNLSEEKPKMVVKPSKETKVQRSKIKAFGKYTNSNTKTTIENRALKSSTFFT